MLCPRRLKKVEATKEKPTLIDCAGDKQAIEARAGSAWSRRDLRRGASAST